MSEIIRVVNDYHSCAFICIGDSRVLCTAINSDFGNSICNYSIYK